MSTAISREQGRAAFLAEAGYWLHLIRSVEEAGRRLYLQGRLPGSFYDGRGQEATSVGAALGLACSSELAVGTEVAVEAERLGVELFKQYPKALVVAGQLIFDEDTLWTRILHNETAFLIQRRLQHAGVPMVVLPVRLSLAVRAPRTVRPAARSRPPVWVRRSEPPPP